MSTLSNLDNSFTDKNSVHSYFDTYQSLFNSKQFNNNNILEIGVYSGGSIKLWNDFFPNSHIYGIDIHNNINNSISNQLFNSSNITLFLNNDAYNNDFVLTHFNNKRFDIIIDDGPHTLDSMISFIKLYSNLLTSNGILIIEDIQDFNWINTLISVTDDNLKPFIHIYDLRNNKNRYDDILFVINKNSSSSN